MNDPRFTPVDMGGRPAWINGVMPQIASAIGFSPTQQNQAYGGANDPYDAGYTNQWESYLGSRGYQLVNLTGPDGKPYQQIVDSKGGAITQPIQKTMDATDGDNAFGVGVGLATGFAGASALGAFGGMGAAPAAADGAGGMALQEGAYPASVASAAAPTQAATAGLSGSQLLNAGKAIIPLVGALTKGSGTSGSVAPGATGSLPTGSAPTTGYLADTASKFAPQSFHATDPGPRPGHTRGPSSAVNLNDPSAAVFGYGTQPIYFQQPTAAAVDPGSRSGIQTPAGVPMADGGTVDDDYGNPLQLDGQASPMPQGWDMDSRASQPFNNPVFDDSASRLPTQDEGPMGWITRLLSSGKDAVMAGGNKNRGPAMLMGGLGLLASLLQSRQPAGYRSAAQLRADVSSGQNAQLGPAAMSYFAKPASHYVPPQSPFKPAAYMADGGPMIPDATARAAYQADHYAHGGSTNHVFMGPGGGQDDRVPAQLSPGEYVVDADVVSALGDGHNAHGAAKLDEMREAIRAHKRSAPVNKIPPAARSPLEYMRGA